jgi:hypothetical protein
MRQVSLRGRVVGAPVRQRPWKTFDFATGRDHDPPVRNYLYISDAKVDSYLPQFSNREKRRLAATLGVNIGVLQASVSGEAKPLSDRVHRLEAVETELRKKGEIGAVHEHLPWIEGVVNAAPARFPGESNVMFFFSDDAAMFLGLAGSGHNVLGNLRPMDATTSHSNLHTLTETLASMDDKYAFLVQKDDAALDFAVHSGVSHTPGSSSWINILREVASGFVNAPKQSIGYVARRLVQEQEGKNGKRFILATPLYLTTTDVV